MASWRKTKTPGVYVAHQTRCPAFGNDDDPKPAVPLLVVYGVVAGALLGAGVGALLHAATGGTRDFASVQGLQAERYEILVDEDVADRAAELLRTADGERDAREVADRGR